MDWSGLKKEAVTDTQIRQALRRDRDLHALDVDVKQSLYRREERSLWRYWAAAASVTLIIGLLWWGNEPTDTPALATQVKQEQLPSTESRIPITDTTSITPIEFASEELKVSTQTEKTIRQFVTDKQIVENCSGPPEPLNTGDRNAITSAQITTDNIAQVPDSTSIEAPLELPFKIQEKPIETTYLAQHIKLNNSEIPTQSLTLKEWVKMKAIAIAQHAAAEGTLPKVHRDSHSFSFEWGSLSIHTN
jgi:hypothetical protein